jgi:arylsulfatase A-like enzyme
MLRGEALAPRALFWRDADEKAVRRGAWKLVASRDKTELFNLTEDLGEQRDLAAVQPELHSQLLAELAAWEQDVGTRGARR